MSRYKPIGISLLPKQITTLDDRAEKLGLSRSKYIQILVTADIQGGLLDCTIDADGGKPIVNIREGVNLVIIDQKVENANKVDLIIKALQTYNQTDTNRQMEISAGNTRKIVEGIVNRQ